MKNDKDEDKRRAQVISNKILSTLLFFISSEMMKKKIK